MDVVTYGMTLKPALPPVEAQRYWDYYQSNGWKVGRNPMKDWKAAVRNWQRNADKPTRTNGKTYEQMEAAHAPDPNSEFGF